MQADARARVADQAQETVEAMVRAAAALGPGVVRAVDLVRGAVQVQALALAPAVDLAQAAALVPAAGQAPAAVRVQALALAPVQARAAVQVAAAALDQGRAAAVAPDPADQAVAVETEEALAQYTAELTAALATAGSIRARIPNPRRHLRVTRTAIEKLELRNTLAEKTSRQWRRLVQWPASERGSRKSDELNRGEAEGNYGIRLPITFRECLLDCGSAIVPTH